MMKVYLGMWFFTNEVSRFYILLPVIPTPGSILSIPLNSLPDDWFLSIKNDCKTSAEKRAWKDLEKRREIEGHLCSLNFEVMNSPPEWSMDHSAGNYAVEINVWPEVWDHNDKH